MHLRHGRAVSGAVFGFPVSPGLILFGYGLVLFFLQYCGLCSHQSSKLSVPMVAVVGGNGHIQSLASVTVAHALASFIHSWWRSGLMRLGSLISVKRLRVVKLANGLILKRVAAAANHVPKNSIQTCTSLEKTEKTSARLMKICSAFFVELMILLCRIEFVVGLPTVGSSLLRVMFAQT